eukprot:scaffold7381_cov310-Pinguiococcus_pyrenoidosus.AAC.54
MHKARATHRGLQAGLPGPDKRQTGAAAPATRTAVDLDGAWQGTQDTDCSHRGEPQPAAAQASSHTRLPTLPSRERNHPMRHLVLLGHHAQSRELPPDEDSNRGSLTWEIEGHPAAVPLAEAPRDLCATLRGGDRAESCRARAADLPVP